MKFFGKTSPEITVHKPQYPVIVETESGNIWLRVNPAGLSVCLRGVHHWKTGDVYTFSEPLWTGGPLQGTVTIGN